MLSRARDDDARAGVIGYVMWTQLVTSDGPYRLFSKTADLLQANAQVVHLLGAPVKVSTGASGRILQYGQAQTKQTRPCKGRVR